MKQNLFMDLAVNYNENDILISEYKHKNILVSHYLIDEKTSKELKQKEGDFYTINFTKEILALEEKALEKEVSKVLKKLMNDLKIKRTLIIGLGNSEIPADSIGVKTTNKIIATNHYNDFLTIPKVALFNPEVTEKTGIKSFNLIKLVVRDIKPNCLIIIDSLATKNKNSLNNCIEINNVGIIPGSAIRDNKEINNKTFNIPVISIGVPLVLNIENTLLTTPDINLTIEMISDILAKSLNNIFLS